MNKEDMIAEITALKSLLKDTDYKCLKFAEGVMPEEEFAPVRAQRASWRARINELELGLAALEEEEGSRV